AWTGARSVKSIRHYFTSTLEEQRTKLAMAQRDAFNESTATFYRDFVRLFEPLRKVCSQHREKYEPQIAGIEKVERKLLELEKILTPVEKAIDSRKKS
ncbi:MAG: hypothetical protein AAF226_01990, partial [Verrucomicrobiota bacterium]